MRRIVLLAVCAAFMLCGCYRLEPLDLPQGGQTKGETSMSQTALETSQTKETSASQTMVETKATQNQIDALESRVAVLESQITELKNTTVTTAKTQGTTSVKITTTTPPPYTPPTPPPLAIDHPTEKKYVPLNVVTKYGSNTLIFTELTTSYDESAAVFLYTDDDSHRPESVPNYGASFLVGKSGRKYKACSMGNGMFCFERDDKEKVDLSDLSTVTLTYAFEGFKPVTVTFDIPGV